MSLEGCISATASELGIDKSDAQEIADRLVAERGKAGPEGATERLRVNGRERLHQGGREPAAGGPGRGLAQRDVG
jgi:hypothetical protein